MMIVGGLLESIERKRVYNVLRISEKFARKYSLKIQCVAIEPQIKNRKSWNKIARTSFEKRDRVSTTGII